MSALARPGGSGGRRFGHPSVLGDVRLRRGKGPPPVRMRDVAYGPLHSIDRPPVLSANLHGVPEDGQKSVYVTGDREVVRTPYFAEVQSVPDGVVIHAPNLLAGAVR